MKMRLSNVDSFGASYAWKRYCYVYRISMVDNVNDLYIE